MVQPLDLELDELMGFLRAVIANGARVLEVGCGAGALARRLLDAGYALTAIDGAPEAIEKARARGVPAVESDFLAYQGGPFDALLFTRSLHHIHPLAAAAEHAARLLAPGGALGLDEFALEAIAAP